MPKPPKFDEYRMIEACLRVNVAFLVGHYKTASKTLRRLVRLGNQLIKFLRGIRRKP
jgi:hypothetical protein